MKKRIFLATNGLCATKFIMSLQNKNIEFYGMVTHEDILANYTYLSYLKKYRIVESGGSDKNYCNLGLIKKLVDEFDCDFVFAGYGHASENPLLAQIMGDRFIGPSYVSMAFLTDKLVSTVIASHLGIPVTKFYTNYDISLIIKEFEIIKTHFKTNSLIDLPSLTIFDDKLKLKEVLLEKSFDKIERYPLFLKITNSGGGKGIFLIKSKEELDEKLVNEFNKKSSIYFEDDVVINRDIKSEKGYFLTEIIDDARHLEVQILADKFKNIFVLGGRECSNQRRRQKLIETSLVFDDNFTENVFKQMCDSAKKLVESVGYYGLATVEFLFAKNKFYFLEVNCRIQVEHPITELVYNLNLPYLLLKVSENKKISLSLKERFKYVMGVRITAETNDFLPSHGKIIVKNNPLKSKSYFSTFNGVIDNNSDSHFGYIFSFSNSKEKMVKNILKDIKNIKIEGISTPLQKLSNFIKEERYNKSVFELEKYKYNKKEKNLLLIFACIIFFDKNKSEKNIRFLYNQKIFTFSIFDLNDKLLIQSNDSYLILYYSFNNHTLILFFKDRTEIINYQKEKDCYKYKDKTFFTKFNIIKSEYSGKIVEINKNRITIECMKVKNIIEIPEEAILLVKENEIINYGDDFYKTNDTLKNKTLKLKNNTKVDLLNEAILDREIPFKFINKPYKNINYYFMNNRSKRIINYLLNIPEITNVNSCVLLNFIFKFIKECLIENKDRIKELLEIRNVFLEKSDNLFVKLINSYFYNAELNFEVKECKEECDFNGSKEIECLIHKKYKNFDNQLIFFENILLEINCFIKILKIKLVRIQKNEFSYEIVNSDFLQTKLFYRDTVLSYKINLKEIQNKENFIKSNKFIDLIHFFARESNEQIESKELFLQENDNKKEKVFNILLTHSKKLNYKLSTKESDEISMKGFLVSFKKMVCVFIINNKEYKNGSFGIKEDILFYLLSRLARKNEVPKIFISNNSGARIGVVTNLIDKLELNNDELMFKEMNQNNEEISVTDNFLSYKNKLISVYGNSDTGPENLSYCTLIAKESVKCYDKTLTLSYIQNMSVGIGAYLSKLSYRIIQKEKTCIILTGHKALNKIFKKEVYKNNLELGGDSVYRNNSMIDLFVKDDLKGIEEIFFMCEIFFKSRKKLKEYKKIEERRNKIKLEDYFINEFKEKHNELEIIELLLKNYKEYNDNYGSGVRIVRGFFQNRSVGVISAINPVLSKESCVKISESIEKFNKEGLDMLIIANWAGFSSTKEELENDIISSGADIINQLVKFKQRILVYLPPFALLKGGSYVCFDRRINNNLRMFVHPTSKITILDAEGVAEVKLKTTDRKEIVFCEKHESVYRMVRNGIVDGVLLVSELKYELEKMLFSEKW